MNSLSQYILEKLVIDKDVKKNQYIFTDKENIYKNVIKMFGKLGESVGKNPRFRSFLKDDIDEWIEKTKYVKHFKYIFGGDINVIPENARSLFSEVIPSFKKLDSLKYKFGKLYTKGVNGSSVGRDNKEFYSITGYQPQYEGETYSLYIEITYKKGKWDDYPSKCGLVIQAVFENDLK